MKSLALALILTLAIGALIFTVCLHTGVGDKVAGPFAGSALTFFTFIHDKVDKLLSARGASKITPGITPITGFQLHPGLMLLYSFLTMFGILELVSGLSGLSAGMAGANPQAAIAIMGIMQFPTEMWLCYVVGRWCGIRSGHSAYWVFPVAYVIVRLADVALLLTIEAWSGKLSNHIFELAYMTTLKAHPVAVITVILCFIAMGEMGVRKGISVRFGAYFNSLLKQIPVSARDTLLSMAYDEARFNAKPTAIISP